MKRIFRFLGMLVTPTAAVLCFSFNVSSQSVTSNGVSLQLNECRYAAGLVTCYLKITSNGLDRNIGKGSRFDGKSNWNISDDLGNSFPHKEIWFGGKEKWDSGNDIGTLVSDLPTPLNFIFEFRPDAKTIKLLDLFIVVENKAVNFQFRNVPIIDDSHEILSGKIQGVYNGTAIALEACESETPSLICRFTAISVGKDRQSSTGWGRELKVVDNLGNYYRPNDALWGGKRSNTLISNTPTPVVVTISNFNSSATSLALIEIHVQDSVLQFRNIPISVALKPISIGFAMASLKDRKSLQNREAFDTQCRELRVTCIITVANGNADRQANDVDNLLTQRVDAIFIEAVNPNYMAAITRKAKTHQVPVSSFAGPNIDLRRAICSINDARGRELCNQLKNR